MKRQAKKTRVITTALTSPKPSFVSAVWAGANQLPWTALKGADAVLTLKAEDLPMTIQKLREAGVEVAQIAFALDKFANEEAVTKWLADGGYEGFVIEKAEDGSFVVKSEAEFDGELRVVEADGVRVTVGALKSAVEAAEKAAAAAPAAEAPAVAVVEPEVQPAAKADAAVIPEQARKGLYAVSELNSLVCGLKWLISDLTVSAAYNGVSLDQSTVSSMKDAASTLVGVMAKMFDVEVEALYAEFGRVAAAASADGAPAPTETAVEDDNAPAVEDGGGAVAAKEGEEPAPAAADAPAVEDQPNSDDPVMKFIREQFANITKSVEGLAGQVTEVASKQDVLGARVEAMETGKPATSPQTRKSADVEDASTGSTDAKKDEAGKAKGLSDITLRGGLGIQVQRFHGEPGKRRL